MKNIYFCFIAYAKIFDCVDHNKLWKFLKNGNTRQPDLPPDKSIEWEYQTTWLASWETCMQVKKQHLELDMEQRAGSKLWKEYDNAVYCHPAYLTYM